MTNNHDADIRAEFEKIYSEIHGDIAFNLLIAKSNHGEYLYQNVIKDFKLYVLGIEKGKRIDNEKMIGLAESILMIYAPYGLSDSKIKTLAKLSVDDYVLSSNTSKDK